MKRDWLKVQIGLMLQSQRYVNAAVFCAGMITGILIVRFFQ